MRASAVVPCLLALTVLAGCLSFKFGRDFPSPEAKMIVVGTTDKASLERMFGTPYQVGLDNGDQMWRWFYGQRNSSAELSKDLSVRFSADGIVKAYAFSSNFPEDMQRLK
ncbi:MAG TPA: hypothetical protein VMS64_27275 [Candidatus Methylomirabilis sp.]|nr:hypothetical protein [Candidatus Methylomirabilis sp.]